MGDSRRTSRGSTCAFRPHGPHDPPRPPRRTSIRRRAPRPTRSRERRLDPARRPRSASELYEPIAALAPRLHAPHHLWRAPLPRDQLAPAQDTAARFPSFAGHVAVAGPATRSRRSSRPVRRAGSSDARTSSTCTHHRRCTDRTAGRRMSNTNSAIPPDRRCKSCRCTPRSWFGGNTNLAARRGQAVGTARTSSHRPLRRSWLPDDHTPRRQARWPLS
jgi:hypothetical protein